MNNQGLLGRPGASRRRTALAFLLFCAAGLLGNAFTFQLILNVDFVFGSIFVLLAVAHLKPPLAVACGVLAASSTYLLWHHPWAVLIFSTEILFVALGNRRKPGNLLLLDALFWLALGLPMVWCCYHLGLGMSKPMTLMMALKQAVNGIFNALLATLLLQAGGFLGSWWGRRPFSRPLRELSLAAMAAVGLLPAFGYLAHSVHSQVQELEAVAVHNVHSGGASARAILQEWLASPRVSPDLPEATSAQLRLLLQDRLGSLTLLDPGGRVRFASAGQALGSTVSPREGQLRPLAEGVRQWLPLPKRGTAVLQRWQLSEYLTELTLGPDGSWTLVAAAPAAPVFTAMTRITLQHLLAFLVAVLITLPVSQLLTFGLTRTLGQLERASNEIPRKLATGASPNWPSSRIQELQSLINNFRAMSAALGHSIRALTQANRGLEQRVSSRTQENDAINRQLEELNHSLAQRVQEAVAELRQKDQVMFQQSRHAAMGEMVGNIAHQWRQPLSALSLVLFNLEEAGRAGELGPEALEQATLEGNRLIQKMSTTIQDFRNFFKTDKHQAAFPVLCQARETVALVTASFKKDRTCIRLENDGELLVLGVANEYSQVLLNLLSNARDAIVGQGQPGLITIRFGQGATEGFLTVTDTGGGIPEAILEKLYDPYFTTKPQGTGVGLYMSKMIVERSLHGRLEARNVPGGAEFSILTPLVVTHA